jgi:hypothetical protein
VQQTHRKYAVVIQISASAFVPLKSQLLKRITKGDLLGSYRPCFNRRARQRTDSWHNQPEP